MIARALIAVGSLALSIRTGRSLRQNLKDVPPQPHLQSLLQLVCEGCLLSIYADIVLSMAIISL